VLRGLRAVPRSGDSGPGGGEGGVAGISAGSWGEAAGVEDAPFVEGSEIFGFGASGTSPVIRRVVGDAGVFGSDVAFEGRRAAEFAGHPVAFLVPDAGIATRRFAQGLCPVVDGECVRLGGQAPLEIGIGLFAGVVAGDCMGIPEAGHRGGGLG